jgi:hypothetical protein
MDSRPAALDHRLQLKFVQLNVMQYTKLVIEFCEFVFKVLYFQIELSGVDVHEVDLVQLQLSIVLAHVALVQPKVVLRLLNFLVFGDKRLVQEGKFFILLLLFRVDFIQILFKINNSVAYLPQDLPQRLDTHQYISAIDVARPLQTIYKGTKRWRKPLNKLPVFGLLSRKWLCAGNTNVRGDGELENRRLSELSAVL